MELDFNTLDARARYFVMTQTIVPRPIAWVLSENETGTFNLAPFSYFQGVCSDPPLIMLSIGHKKDGTPKDTCANIHARKHFVVHVTGRDDLEPMNQSSATFEKNISELDALSLKTTDFGFSLPRLTKSRVAMACTHYETHEVGPNAQALILGQIQTMWIADDVVSKDGKRIRVDPQNLDPVARLGLNLYTSLGEVIEVERP